MSNNQLNEEINRLKQLAGIINETNNLSDVELTNNGGHDSGYTKMETKTLTTALYRIIKGALQHDKASKNDETIGYLIEQYNYLKNNILPMHNQVNVSNAVYEYIMHVASSTYLSGGPLLDRNFLGYIQKDGDNLYYTDHDGE